MVGLHTLHPERAFKVYDEVVGSLRLSECPHYSFTAIDLLTAYRFEDPSGTRIVRTRGGLLGHWCAWTHTAVQLFKQIKALAPDAPVPSELLTLAAQVTDANGAFFDAHNAFGGCIAGMHEVLRRQGLLDGIWCLDPHETLGKGQAEEIDRVYRMYPKLNDDEFVRRFLQKENA